jgi:hypothetical protein
MQNAEGMLDWVPRERFPFTPRYGVRVAAIRILSPELLGATRAHWPPKFPIQLPPGPRHTPSPLLFS